MAMDTETLQVILAANGFYPWAFRWQGRALRVLSVDQISTSGTERRFRVRTAIGHFELGLLHRRLPVARAACAELARPDVGALPADAALSAAALAAPRLPPDRDTTLGPAAEMRRESHANRLALVRQ